MFRVDKFVIGGTRRSAVRAGSIFLGINGMLMPCRTDGPPPDLKYFNGK